MKIILDSKDLAKAIGLLLREKEYTRMVPEGATNYSCRFKMKHTNSFSFFEDFFRDTFPTELRGLEIEVEFFFEPKKEEKPKEEKK